MKHEPIALNYKMKGLTTKNILCSLLFPYKGPTNPKPLSKIRKYPSNKPNTNQPKYPWALIHYSQTPCLVKPITQIKWAKLFE